MGLIKKAIDCVKGTLADQYQHAIRCEDMGNNILMIKKSTGNGIIRNGSVIIVNPAQLAVLVDNGRVIDATAEQGVFEFNSAASPSFFAGNFGGMFKEMWTRFAFGGSAYQDQAVYFINIREIINNGFGTPAPVMYRDWEHCTADIRRPGAAVPMRVAIRCSGNYTFQIEQPAVFLQRIGGTIPVYQKDELADQMRIEIVSTFQAVLNSLCDEQNRVFPMDLPAKSSYIKELMDRQVFDKPIRDRGIRIVGFNVLNVDLDDESKRKIDKYETVSDAVSQQAILNSAVKDAANNSAGAGVGFMNLNLSSGAIGSMFQNNPPATNVMQGGYAPQPQAAPVAAQGQVICGKCGTPITGKFCSGCGSPAPAPAERFCSNCGQKASGRFCANCGAQLL